MSQLKDYIISLSLFMLVGCAAKPFPYFDSAMNDKNRAPSSIGIPVSVESTQFKKTNINQQSQIDSWYINAEVLSQQGKNKEAIELLENASAADPKSAVLNHRLATEYFRIGKIKEATEKIDKALALDPKNQTIGLLAAGIYSTNNQYAKAEKIYKSVIKNHKDSPEAYLYLAALYSEQKKFKDAVAYFSKAEKFEDYDQRHLVYYYRARTYLEYNRSKYINQVKSDLKKSIKIKPEFLESLQLLGKIIERTEGQKKAFEFYAKYQKENGPSPQVAEVLAQNYLKTGDYDRAYEQLEIVEASATDPTPVKLKMALILIDKKMYDRAFIRLEELNTLEPDSDKIKYYLAAVADEMKNFDVALKHYTQMPESSGFYEDSLKRAAFIYKLKGEVDDAVNLLEKLVKAKPNHLQNYLAMSQVYEDNDQLDKALKVLVKVQDKFKNEAQFYYSLGVVYDKKNEKDKMLTSMKKSVDLDPKNPVALNYLAYSLLDLGRELPMAEKLVLKAHSLSKNDPFILDTVGWLYYKKSDYKKSISYLEKAYKLMPDAAVIVEHLADVYVKLNLTQKANTLYKKALSLETDDIKKKQIIIKISSIENNQNRQPASVKTVEVLSDSRASSKDGSK